MDLYVLGAIVGVALFLVVIAYLVGKSSAKRVIGEHKTAEDSIKAKKVYLASVLSEIESATEERKSLDSKILELIVKCKEVDQLLEPKGKALSELEESLSLKTEEFKKLNLETEPLQQLKGREADLSISIEQAKSTLEILNNNISSARNTYSESTNELQSLMSRLDLYSRVDEYAQAGHFEMPEYLYETSARFVEEIRITRDKQKALIKNSQAILVPGSVSITGDPSQDKKIVNGQTKLLLAVFNIECDLLISKLNPSNYGRSLEQIEKLANKLEKSTASLSFGFSIEYVELKFEECRLQFESTLKKKEEQDEQRLIREQIREEQKAIKEYEQALANAEAEEKLYRQMLEKARAELSDASEEMKAAAELRIAGLEAQLNEALSKEERVKSMAEQTRKGHVYVISNTGSFGENIYKIGLTRRLEPMDRVKELGDASVPFSFDVHAMIFADDAPSLETSLHREFTNQRVNAVNLRKEFFNTDLDSIKEAVERLSGSDAEFKMTALAEEYYESRRLQGDHFSQPDTKAVLVH
jgi:hypothetical protein